MRRRTPGPGWFLVLACLSPGVFAAGSDSAERHSDRIVAVIAERIEEYNRHGRFDLPAFSADEFDALASGEPVVVQLSDSDGDATRSVAFVGAKLIEAPRLLVWLTALGGNNDYRSNDDDDKAAGRSRKSRVTHAMLSWHDDGSYVRYQHVRLPWPFRDRHWTVICRKNVGAAEATADNVWEHYWSLERDGLGLASAAVAAGDIESVSAKVLARSVYLPANEGAWITLELDPARTLLLAYVDVDLGGNFPRSLVRGFTQRQLKAGLNALPGYVSRVSYEYEEDPAIHDGHGRRISPQEAKRVASAWRIATTTSRDRHHP